MAIRAEIRLEGIEALAEALGRVVDLHLKPAKDLFVRLGETWVKRIFVGNIEAGGRPQAFEPLGEAARNIRSDKLGATKAERPILVRDSSLKNSIAVESVTDTEIVFRPRIFFARLLHDGGVTSPKSAIPGKTIPARPFMVIPPEEVDSLFDEIEAFYSEP